ncbi:MAG: hypothetical protein P0Y60_10370 [Candidatus Microbacterium colombiense]|nr:MAG: hypothetical protein P0Y60_10370 [Microbacterium sp.]
MNNTSSYWAAIAQIIPVLMLALIVEGRFLARQFTDKDRFSTNVGARASYAAVFAINALALFVGFLLALAGARGNGLNEVLSTIAEVSLFLGVITVFVSPVISLASALIGDKIEMLHRRLPYSASARAERRKRRARDVIAGIRREYVDIRLVARMKTSQAYVALYERERGVEAAAMWSGPDFNFTALDDLASKIECALKRLHDKVARAEADFAATGAELTDVEIEEFRAALTYVSSR